MCFISLKKNQKCCLSSSLCLLVLIKWGMKCFKSEGNSRQVTNFNVKTFFISIYYLGSLSENNICTIMLERTSIDKQQRCVFHVLETP